MKILVLYRPNSEHRSLVDEFVRSLAARTDGVHTAEMIDVNTRDGAALASLYDVMRFPAIMVVQNDGRLQQYWEGDTLPLIDEVIAYNRA